MTASAAKTAVATPKSAPCANLKTKTEAITAHQVTPDLICVRPSPKSG
jgi:hypothetical protein